MNFWHSIHERLKEKGKLVLLYVLDSKGSSPGRQGFKMLVAEDGWMQGSIGGGFMEHKLVELAKAKMMDGKFDPFVKKQIHRTNETKDRSGMICSGEQWVAFYYLDQSHLQLVKKINIERSVLLDQNGISVDQDSTHHGQLYLEALSEHTWRLTEKIAHRDIIYIIGAGHVGLALSQLMKQLNFHVVLIDDRSDLNTYIGNQYADKKIITDYDRIDEVIDGGDGQHYIVLMSFGYQSDKLIIKRLVNKNWKYFGVMGSEAKMDKLITDLKEDGFEPTALDKLHTPIGLKIHSKTPAEIAVSIAAEIIRLKNQS